MLVLEAETTGFQDPWKGGWEPMVPSGRKTVLGGLDWKQTGIYSQPAEGQKVNPGENLLSMSGGLKSRRGCFLTERFPGY